MAISVYGGGRSRFRSGRHRTAMGSRGRAFADGDHRRRNRIHRQAQLDGPRGLGRCPWPLLEGTVASQQEQLIANSLGAVLRHGARCRRFGSTEHEILTFWSSKACNIMWTTIFGGILLWNIVIGSGPFYFVGV